MANDETTPAEAVPTIPLESVVYVAHPFMLLGLTVIAAQPGAVAPSVNAQTNTMIAKRDFIRVSLHVQFQ